MDSLFRSWMEFSFPFYSGGRRGRVGSVEAKPGRLKTKFVYTRFSVTLYPLFVGSLWADTVRVERIDGEQHRVISSGEDFRKIIPESSLEPEFDSSMTTNVTSPAGKTAYLTCRVKNLGNRTVNEYFNNDIASINIKQPRFPSLPVTHSFSYSIIHFGC